MKGDVITIAEEKFERRLSAEMAKVNERITIEISKVNQRITEEATKLDRRISEETSKLGVKMIKWMFIFWVGQFGMMLGLFFAFLR